MIRYARAWVCPKCLSTKFEFLYTPKKTPLD